MNRTYASMGLLLVAASSLAVVACGEDGGDSAPTTAAATAAPTVPTTAAPVTTAAGGQYAEVCALATEMSKQDGPPTHAQLMKYQTLLPSAIAAPASIAVSAFLPVPEGDFVNFFKAAAKDEVEAALLQIDAWETANCGIAHDEDVLAPGSTRDIEAGAARVDVRAEDYKLTLPSTVAPGRTSFVLTDHGAEVHHMVIFKLADGVTFEQAMTAEDSDGMITGTWSSGLAFPDGEDEEAVTFDLTPGNYGIACFISGADGQPHAFSHNMRAEFTVG